MNEINYKAEYELLSIENNQLKDEIKSIINKLPIQNDKVTYQRQLEDKDIGTDKNKLKNLKNEIESKIILK